MSIKEHVIELLLALFRAQGFITEGELLERVVGFNLDYQEIDWVTERLLNKGVIIVDDYDINEPVEGDYDRSQIDYDELFNRVIELEPELTLFIEEVREIRPPQHREWISLMKVAKSGNRCSFERLLSMYLRVVVKISVWYYDKYGVSLADTIQDGCLGLINAIEKYDEGKHGVFASYASMWIRQTINRNMVLPELVPLYFPDHFLSSMLSIYDIVGDHLCEECSEGLFCAELIRAIEHTIDCSPASARLLVHHYFCEWLSIEEELMRGNEYLFDDEHEFEELMSSNVVANELKQKIETTLSILTEREQYVLASRYGLLDDQYKTLEQVGSELGVTRERVRQIQLKALRRLRHPSRARSLKEYL